MPGNTPFQAVLFDLDGTLLDTLADIADAVNAVLAQHDCPIYPVEDYKTFIGEGVMHLVERSLPAERRDEETVAHAALAVLEEYKQRWKAKTKPYPGIPEMLDKLVERGFKLAILSNKPDDFTKLAAEHFLERWHFEEVIGAGKYPPKPDPTAALEIALRMGIAPKQFLYMGDSGVDMQTATAAGMHPIGVLWGFREQAELEAGGAINIVNEPGNVMALL